MFWTAGNKERFRELVLDAEKDLFLLTQAGLQAPPDVKQVVSRLTGRKIFFAYNFAVIKVIFSIFSATKIDEPLMWFPLEHRRQRWRRAADELVCRHPGHLLLPTDAQLLHAQPVRDSQSNFGVKIISTAL